MHPIVLTNQSAEGDLLEATFIPEKGMNLVSFKRGTIEVIDQSTRKAFEECFGGLGPLIGPHFHRRDPSIVAPIKDPAAFPHISFMQAKGSADPFSHGIGRYAPWKAEGANTKLKAVLSGKDTWNGVPLADLEGQNFKMEFAAELTPKGLKLDLSVVSEADSIVGIHYYYSLHANPSNGHSALEKKGDQRSMVISRVQDKYYDQTQLCPIPPTWDYDQQHILKYDLQNGADFAFHPHPDPLCGRILLVTPYYRLQTEYKCASQENCWQLYHPAGASFVCIEPLSAQNPRRANLSVSSISINLEILPLEMSFNGDSGDFKL